MTRTPRRLLVLPVAAACLASVVTPVAIAQDQTASNTCPQVQIVVVRSQAEASGLDNADSGFLGGIVAPVVTAANDGAVKDPTAGFSAAPAAKFGDVDTATKVAAEQGNKSWKPDVWGAKPSTNETGLETKKDSWKPDVWGTKPSTQATSTATPVKKADGPAKVGRTYVNIATGRAGAFIPGVHSETVPDWRQVIQGGVDHVSATLEDIHTKCANTRVALIGEADGAAVVSEVARNIGNGESNFPADLVSGVATFANTARAEGEGFVASRADRPQAVPGTSGAAMQQISAVNPAGAAGGGIAVAAEAAGPHRSYGKLAGRTVSLCAEGDARCATKKDALLVRLAAATERKVNFLDDPLGSLQHITDTLGPAVLLGTMETLAQDINYGPRGFSVKAAKNVDSTLIGRIVSNTERNVSDCEFQDRLMAAAQTVGGMALNVVGTAVAKSVTPQAIATVGAAFQAAGPQGAGAAALAVFVPNLSNEVLSAFNPETLNTAQRRLVQEAEAARLENTDVVQAALASATTRQQATQGYRSTRVGESNTTFEGYAKQWLTAQAADVIGRDGGQMLNTVLAQNNLPQVPPGVFNAENVQNTLNAFLKA
ncbi:cutinase family protein [Corynebacterium sp. CCM 9185]|uniref:Cutinase family protein n=1 Tax=Corynebacterium marambiense TaxID=2765364 RepID=A0ABS0VXV5_9CORY|nr:cutinase family protein [Corynebacterium marambiense]MBI9001612.1 cutinase family protein [Corynebacterium marambiense]MCK7662078.1 cutinase family protein [Corynebacterium marambiense]